MTAPTSFLTFTLGADEYAVELLRVREVVAWSRPTRVPTAPRAIAGLVYLRGAVLPVVDLGAHLALPAREPDKRTSIAVVEVSRDGETVPLGLVVDRVRRVVEIDPAELSPPPPFGAPIRLDFLRGVARSASASGGVLLVLDLDRTLSPDEIAAARSIASGVEGARS